MTFRTIKTHRHQATFSYSFVPARMQVDEQGHFGRELFSFLDGSPCATLP